MSDPGKAVFLSYASQDADAARRICEALRAAGVEVWFDQSELRGGDAWDQSIRRQIKECALFIPIVSANTQARREGYFRLEWKLADDRTHLMAKGTRFILPICVDDTKDWDAIVPDSFTTVQWTRLAGGNAAGAFADRVVKLLAGEGASASGRGAVPVRRDDPDAAGARRRKSALPSWLGPAIVGLAAIAALAVWRPWRPVEKPSAPESPAQPATPAANEVQQLSAKAKALYDKVGFTRDDLAVAEDLTLRATELDPTSATAWATRAGVHASYILRNWDAGEKRRQDTQTFANRALALNPAETEAMLALSRVLSRQGANDQAETILRQALTLAPDDNRIRRALGIAVELQGPERLAEGRALLEDAVRRHPRDVLARYDLAQSYNTNWGPGNDAAASFTAMLEQLDAALAVEPWGGALLLKAQMIMALKGDLATMRTTLDQIPPADRPEDRAVATAMWCGLLERNLDHVVAASALTARNYFEDLTVAGPKAWFLALAHRSAGQENLARLDWQAAEAVMRQRLRDQPGNVTETARLAVTLAWLGSTGEAAALMAPIEATLHEQPSPRLSRLVAYYYAGLGDAARAAPYQRAALYQTWFLTPATLPLDPWWDKLRGQPEFDRFLAEAKRQTTIVAAPVAQSSVTTASAPGPMTAPAGPIDPQLRRAAELVESSQSITADINVAEDLVKTVLAARPTDPAATILMGRIQVYYLLRGFDRSEDRFALARQYAERSLTLAPDDPDSLANLGTYLYVRRVELPRAARLFRQAIALRPTDPYLHRMLGNVLGVTDSVPESEVLDAARQMADRFPQDALVQYEASRHFRDAAQLELTEHYLDLAIKLGPVANAQIAKAELALAARGDPSGLKALPGILPDHYLGTDRVVFAQFVYGLVTKQYDLALDALRPLPEPWMIDFDYTGPTSLLAGEVLLLQNKPELARMKFEEAQAEMGRHRAEATRNFSTIWLNAWILMRLGRTEEARARNALVFPELSRPFRIYLGTNWWFSPIPGSLLMSERPQALALIREAIDFQYGRQIIRHALDYDPRMAPFRDDEEIAALLAAPAEKK